MTSRQKIVLWRWVLSIVIISRLLFLIPEYFPNALPEKWVNQTWISLQIHFDTETTNLVITHQFIDPLILGLITCLVFVLFLMRNAVNNGLTILMRLLIIMGLLPTSLVLAYLIFYTLNANTFISLLLWITNSLGSILKYGSIFIAIIMIFRFFIMGIIKYFQDDHENEKLKTISQSEETSD